MDGEASHDVRNLWIYNGNLWVKLLKHISVAVFVLLTRRRGLHTDAMLITVDCTCRWPVARVPHLIYEGFVTSHECVCVTTVSKTVWRKMIEWRCWDLTRRVLHGWKISCWSSWNLVIWYSRTLSIVKRACYEIDIEALWDLRAYCSRQKFDGRDCWTLYISFQHDKNDLNFRKELMRATKIYMSGAKNPVGGVVNRHLWVSRGLPCVQTLQEYVVACISAFPRTSSELVGTSEVPCIRIHKENKERAGL